MKALSRYELWYGRDAAPVQMRELRAGPLTAYLDGPDLRYIRRDGVEVVRRLYVAVRDHNWHTIPGEYAHVALDRADDHFTVSFDVRHRQHAVDFAWHADITGRADGTIVYRMDGSVNADFRYNRIGFCVLHPPRESAGRPYRGRTPEGAIEGTLPRLIMPQRIVDGAYIALFPAVASLDIDLASGVAARFDFEGDLFEMEDQRNWTDNSFKTYCTPLALPWPRDAHRGQKIAQQVAVTAQPAEGASPAAPAGESAEPRISLGEPLGRTLPSLGLGMASHGEALSAHEIALLKDLRLDHLRVDLHPHDPAHRDNLDRAIGLCTTLDCGLELALFVTDNADAELAGLAFMLGTEVPVVRVLVFHESELSTAGHWVTLARERLQGVAPRALFAGGTNVYFTQLNVLRPQVEAMDAVTYSINPQVHAFDEVSLMETLETQGETVRSARSFCGNLPLVVSPVTLKPRFNANATGPELPPGPGELPPAVDPRQMSLFGAAWTVGSVKYLAESGVTALTYYETTGWRGVMETETGAPASAPFASRPGMIFPLYHVFADLAEWKSAQLLDCRSGNTLAVDALAVRAGGTLHVLLANVTSVEQRITVAPLPAERVSLRRLDDETAPVAMADPPRFRAMAETLDVTAGALTVTLAPYAVIRLDAEAPV